MTRGGDDGLDRERRCRAQDRADIVRIGDLVEHQHDAFMRQRVDVGRLQRIGFREQALMHGVGPEALIDQIRPDDFRRHAGVDVFVRRRRAAFSVSSSFRILRCGLPSAAATVCQP